LASQRVKHFLGIDGGGTKTAFVLIEETGRVLATHTEGPAYYPEIGLEPMRKMLAQGIRATVHSAGLTADNIDFAFIGLPAYGEDSALLTELENAASPLLNRARYRCDNDAVCGWAGALAAEDGINVIAGTGSMAYGEFAGRNARAGGWGELFGDEGSAYWIVREGLALFSRMSDGRAERSPFYDRVRSHFGLHADLDLCAAIYGQQPVARSQLASLCSFIAESAVAGDVAAAALFDRAADELLQMIDAVRLQLTIPHTATVTLSYSGGLFRNSHLLLERLKTGVAKSSHRYRLCAPRLSPAAGAALYAARLHHHPLTPRGIAVFESAVALTGLRSGAAAAHYKE
jgi:N-acetylglucosamine kinase-like BadF-type ATPase